MHLPSTPYGPYQVRKGWPRSKVLELERTLRLPALHRVLRALPDLAERMPVFLTGDFNSPSHLDWTQAVADSRREVPYAVAWPASKALAEAGFGDSYRDAHPDPVADPGYTWSPGGPETQDKDFFDRIDWVLHAGASTTVDSRLVGERGNPQVDLPFAMPFPTDHRGVVSTFDVTPGQAPVLVSPEHRRVFVGDQPLQVRFHGDGTPHEVVALVPRDAASPLLTARSTAGHTDGVVSLDKSGLQPGRYDVVLVDEATGSIGARAPVWVYAAGARPRLRTDASSYDVGERIRVAFTGAPGQLFDWVGLFRCFNGLPGGGLVPGLPLHPHAHRGIGDLQRRHLARRRHGAVAAATGPLRRTAARRRQLPRDREVQPLHDQALKAVSRLRPAPANGRGRPPSRPGTPRAPCGSRARAALQRWCRRVR